MSILRLLCYWWKSVYMLIFYRFASMIYTCKWRRVVVALIINVLKDRNRSIFLKAMLARCLQSPLLIAVTIKRKIELKNVTKAKLLFPFLISTGLTFQPIIIPFSCKLVVKSDALPSPLQQTAFFFSFTPTLEVNQAENYFFFWRMTATLWYLRMGNFPTNVWMPA